MKIVITGLFFLITGGFTIQESKEIDFVLVVDGTIITGGVSNLRMLVKNDNKEYRISAKYYPGSLTLNNSDYEKLISSNTTTIELSFSVVVEQKGKWKDYDYIIPYEKGWFNERYNVLNIYNLNKRKYKKKHRAIDKDGHYSFSIDLGHYSVFNIKTINKG